MGYRHANIGNGRRIGDRSSGPRSIGYDAKPRGLAGTNSDIRRMAGTSTIADYKKNKQKKDNKKRPDNNPPYPPEQDDVPPEMKPYNPNEGKFNHYVNDDQTPVELGDKAADKSGSGWDLVYYGLNGKPKLLTNSEEATGFGESESQYRSMFHIINVSSDDSVRLPTAPLENGMVKHDHKVEEPRKLTVTGWVERANAMKVKEIFETARRATALNVYFDLVSPWRVYRRMYLQKFTSRVSTEKYDVYDYTLNLQELLIATSVIAKTSDPGKASNSAKGAAQGK